MTTSPEGEVEILLTERLTVIRNYQQLPATALGQIRKALEYTRAVRLYGREAIEVFGKPQAVYTEPRRFFYTNGEDLITTFGFWPRIRDVLDKHKIPYHVRPVFRPRTRPRCWEPDLERALRFPLRPLQDQCIRAVLSSPGGVVAATMGVGKTYMFAPICAGFPYARIAIVCPQVPVCRTIHRRLCGHFPAVGLIGGGKQLLGERITVFSADSVHHSDQDYDIVLVDEAHAVLSDKRSEALRKAFPHARYYAFTGTPKGRSDGTDARMEAIFGPVIIRITYQEAVAAGLVVPIHVRWVPVMGDDVPSGQSDISKYRHKIWRNPHRNRIIAQDIQQNCSEEDQVLVSVATVEHAAYLWKFLPDFELCFGSTEDEKLDQLKRWGILPEDYEPPNRVKREDIYRRFESGELRRVIATDIWSTGVSFDQLQVLYRADARSSEILDNQWPGRVSRTFEGKPRGLVVDFTDHFSSWAYNKALRRRAHYRKNGWTQDWPR